MHTILLSCALVAIFFTCNRNDQKTEEALARVDDNYLYIKELQLGDHLFQSSLGETVEDWIDREVLLHHTGRSIIDWATLDARLGRARDQIASQLLLDSLVYRNFYPSSEEIRQYYHNHREEFIFSAEAAVVVHLAFLHLNDARDAWQLLQTSDLPVDTLLSGFNFDRQLVYHNRVLPSLNEAVFSSSESGFRGPISSEFGFHLLRVEKLFALGDSIPLALATNRIVDILFQQRLAFTRAMVLDSLREEVYIEIFVD